MSLDSLRPVVFLDRDGTLIQDTGYIGDWHRVQLLPGVGKALRKIQKRYPLVLISNQSGIGRGLITIEQAGQVHDRTIKLLNNLGVHLDGSYYCPHIPEDNCACRKPLVGLFLQAERDLKIELKRSIMIGDKPSDIQAGKIAGCRTLFLGSNNRIDNVGADQTASDWFEISNWILGIKD
jgi:histidinol-phosphate phosphatase family protein